MRSEQKTSTSEFSGQSWDIFSSVVDNYGDIGVCWRLARQLTNEHQLKVRLWTDDLISFQKINPEVDPLKAIQQSRGVEIRHWRDANQNVVPADVVVEAFACELPANYIEAMAKSGRKHAWVNLEYLSAEEWIESHHGLASPHPRLALTKYFFFPGFTSDTGGLILETPLPEQRKSFQETPALRQAFWKGIGIPEPSKEEIRISLFCYERNAANALFQAWAGGNTPITCIIPEGVADSQITSFFKSGQGNLFKAGSLTVRVIPFLEQDGYDRLLWACDFNFVRGEDSFVRAQWAARPMIWQIYPQEGDAHLAKLRAFLGRYATELSPEPARVFSEFTEAWNHAEAAPLDWEGLLACRAALEEHAKKWANSLIKKEDLARNLVIFCNSKLK